MAPIVWIFTGLAVAWLLSIIGTKVGFGGFSNFMVAILGGLLGGYLSTLFFPTVDPIYQVTLQGFISSAVVALVFVAGYRILMLRVHATKKKAPVASEEGTTL